MKSAADFSECRRYRYDLWRQWGETEFPYCMFIGLNPSTADETEDDPTIRRCIAYAKAWGYSALCMTNLFAFRATEPKVMKAEPSPISEPSSFGLIKNDLALLSNATHASIVIAAWGKDGKHLRRDKDVIRLLPPLHCLKLNKDGTPAHPLYLLGNLHPIPFS
jgi:hypothetical protein